MQNKNLEIAAKILGTTAERLGKFDEESINEMTAAVEMIPIDTEENVMQLHKELNNIWQKAVARECMVTVAKETGVSLDTLLSLDIQSQLMIDWDYNMALADEDTERAVRSVYENVQRALAIIELPDVAELLGVEYDKLRLYSREVWEQLCGAYAMQYEDGGDNSELIAELNEILDEAEEETDE